MDLSPLGPQAAPRRSLLTEERFAAALGQEAEEFLQVVARVRDRFERGWVERDLYALYRQSTDLERYLDHHGASDNQSFALLRELLARVRWLALANSTLVHLRGRLMVYPPTPDGWVGNRLVPELQDCLAKLGKLLLRGLEGLEAEWRCRHAPWPNVEPVKLAETPPRPMLAADMLHSDVAREEANQGEMKAAARWAWRVQRLFDSLPQAFAEGAQDGEEAAQVLREHLREAQVRELEARAHNLQSDYDTQIRGSQDAKEDEVLPMLRGATSQGLHLLEAATALTHLMERHENYSRIPEARASLQQLLPWDELRLLLVNQIAKLAYEAFEVASKQSVGLIERLTRPSFVELPLPQDINLHARPLSLVVRVVNHFETPVEMEMGGQRASAASMMSLLVLAGSHPDCRELRFHGDERVLAALRELIFAGIGERGMDALPQSLDFLRT
jgi:phosphotransferase system HPr-like phosphotransfer protein